MNDHMTLHSLLTNIDFLLFPKLGANWSETVLESWHIQPFIFEPESDIEGEPAAQTLTPLFAFIPECRWVHAQLILRWVLLLSHIPESQFTSDFFSFEIFKMFKKIPL